MKLLAGISANGKNIGGANMDKKVYNSVEQKDFIEITAPYYNAINPTSIFFQQEEISVSVNSLGHIAFFDENEKPLGFVDFPVSDDPSEYAHSAQYGKIRCSCYGKEITVSLPVYRWSDSYPHCDGESDRWTRHIDRWFDVVFNCESKKILVLGK